MPESPDAALVLRARNGDAAAFEVLVRTHQRRAVSVAYRLLGNSEDACDVVQDAFVRAYRRLDQLEHPSRFGAWLMRVVTNLSLNYRRSRATRAAGSLDDFVSQGVETRAAEIKDRRPASELAECLPAELHAAITEAVASLPDKQRLALILFSVEGLPQREVAEVLDCSVELVKWNVFQARKRLKELLADYL